MQPPVGYQRGSLKEYDWHTPLNHLVDAVPAGERDRAQVQYPGERDRCRQCSPEQFQKAKESLTVWRDNDVKLEPSLKMSDITAELVPLSQSVAQVATIGLRALDDLEKHRVPDAATTQSDAQVLKAAEKPQAVLRNMIVAPVEMLVQAARTRSRSRSAQNDSEGGAGQLHDGFVGQPFSFESKSDSSLVHCGHKISATRTPF